MYMYVYTINYNRLSRSAGNVCIHLESCLRHPSLESLITAQHNRCFTPERAEDIKDRTIQSTGAVRDGEISTLPALAQ